MRYVVYEIALAGGLDVKEVHDDEPWDPTTGKQLASFPTVEQALLRYFEILNEYRRE